MPVELQMQKMVLAMKLASGGNAKNNQWKNLIKKSMEEERELTN
jgi:hypothetical protein